MSPLNPVSIVPASKWILNYRKSDLPSDALAGMIVAIMLVPQAMAYALLAGLPPQYGLYASILPLVAYAIFGSSRTLAVGPVMDKLEGTRFLKDLKPGKIYLSTHEAMTDLNCV